MKISIRSKNHACVSAFEKKIIRLAANFFANILMSSRIVENLSIQINVIKSLRNDQKILGSAGPSEHADERYPRNFAIDLDRQKKLKSIIMCLAHEMVHVKQYARGELVYHNRNDLVTFQKKMYKDDDYWLSPWEIEAYGYEVCMFQKFYPTYKMLLKEFRQ